MTFQLQLDLLSEPSVAAAIRGTKSEDVYALIGTRLYVGYFHSNGHFYADGKLVGRWREDATIRECRVTAWCAVANAKTEIRF